MNTTVTYSTKPNGLIEVRVGNKPVGLIKEVVGGFQYFPKGQKTGGEVFRTLASCQRSLEGDE